MLEHEQPSLMPMVTPFDGYVETLGKVSSTGLVIEDRNRYRQGGPAGYGLRRILVDQNGSVKSELARGEHKSLQTDRVILMPGPDDETRIVNLIYLSVVH